jgi:predicted nucleic acid-binding protein
MDNSSAVFDSCVLAAAFFQEDLTRKAQEMLMVYDPITVDFARIEITNVACKRILHGKTNPDIIRSALNTSVEFLNDACFLLKASDIIDAAYECAITHKITVYDALYLTAAMKEERIFITADYALYKAAHDVHEIVLLTT